MMSYCVPADVCYAPCCVLCPVTLCYLFLYNDLHHSASTDLDECMLHRHHTHSHTLSLSLIQTFIQHTHYIFIDTHMYTNIYIHSLTHTDRLIGRISPMSSLSPPLSSHLTPPLVICSVVDEPPLVTCSIVPHPL